MPDPYLSLILSAVMAIVAACGIVAAMTLWAQRHGPGRLSPVTVMDGTAFLLSGGMLIDATGPARELLAAGGRRGGSDLEDIVALLDPRYPGLRQGIAPGGGLGQRSFAAVTGQGSLDAEWSGDTVRLVIHGTAARTTEIHPITLAGVAEDAAVLRALSSDLSLVAWVTGPEGAITWASESYLALLEEMERGPSPGSGWPPPLPGELAWPAKGGPVLRVTLAQAGQGAARTYDIRRRPFGAGHLHVATSADSAAASERLAKDFVQTLTRTFAELDEGLAIFDADRRLVLFNPALGELTGLPTEFLVRRPMIQQVLDRLRDANILPEPKNYRSWRDQVGDLEAAARRGTFAETWALSDGRTFRVTGRPHPEGAIALLIKDVSGEVSMARRFRAEFETTQAVLDSLDEAIAVFSGSGTIRMTNAAYAAGWGSSAESLGDIRLRDEIGQWQMRCTPGGVLASLPEVIEELQGQAPTVIPLRLLDGRSADLTLNRLGGGDLAVRFSLNGAVRLPRPEPGAATAEPIRIGDRRGG